MLHRSSTSSIVLAAALMLATAGAKAHDEAKYPDWNGQWFRHGSAANVPFDPAKPLGRGQQAPLTPEYQAKFEASLADQAAGGMASTPIRPACRAACRA
jgi:hypothetical protein